MKFSGARKFRATWTTAADGTKHPSKGQAGWWDRMRLKERAKMIFNLVREPRWDVYIARDCPYCRDHGVYIGHVKGDAEYDDADRVHRFVDYKGVEGDTPLSAFKRKFVLARFGVDIELVGPAVDEAAKAKAKREKQPRRP